MYRVHPPVDEIAMRRYIRHEMRQRGMLTFCDDEDVTAQQPVQGKSDAAPQLVPAGINTTEERSLIKVGLAATSTDNEVQSIQNVIEPDTEFWSSTGSQSQAVEEGLLFQLRSPACAVKKVRMAVYRAHYQHGDPLYPPASVSIYIGTSPCALQPASPRYPCLRTEQLQEFDLYDTAPLGGYMLVRFHGKLQQQWEDLQYYIAIRHIAAYGDMVLPQQIPDLRRGMISQYITTLQTVPGDVPTPQTSAVKQASTALNTSSVDAEVAHSSRRSGRHVQLSGPTRRIAVDSDMIMEGNGDQQPDQGDKHEGEGEDDVVEPQQDALHEQQQREGSEDEAEPEEYAAYSSHDEGMEGFTSPVLGANLWRGQPRTVRPRSGSGAGAGACSAVQADAAVVDTVQLVYGPPVRQRAVEQGHDNSHDVHDVDMEQTAPAGRALSHTGLQNEGGATATSSTLAASQQGVQVQHPPACLLVPGGVDRTELRRHALTAGMAGLHGPSPSSVSSSQHNQQQLGGAGGSSKRARGVSGLFSQLRYVVDTVMGYSSPTASPQGTSPCEALDDHHNRSAPPTQEGEEEEGEPAAAGLSTTTPTATTTYPASGVATAGPPGYLGLQAHQLFTIAHLLAVSVEDSPSQQSGQEQQQWQVYEYDLEYDA